MHRRIAEVIDKMVKDNPYQDVKCVVHKQPTDGFWEVKLFFKKRNFAHTEALIRTLPHIGTVFGEGLYIRDRGKIVVVS